MYRLSPCDSLMRKVTLGTGSADSRTAECDGMAAAAGWMKQLFQRMSSPFLKLSSLYNI